MARLAIHDERSELWEAIARLREKEGDVVDGITLLRLERDRKHPDLESSKPSLGHELTSSTLDFKTFSMLPSELVAGPGSGSGLVSTCLC
jgi:hypothetical protein